MEIRNREETLTTVNQQEANLWTRPSCDTPRTRLTVVTCFLPRGPLPVSRYQFASAIVLATRERELELDSVVRSAGNRKLRLACGSSDQNSAAKLENVCPHRHHRDWQRITPGIGFRSQRCVTRQWQESACVCLCRAINRVIWIMLPLEFPQLLWADLCLTNAQIYLWPCANDNA